MAIANSDITAMRVMMSGVLPTRVASAIKAARLSAFRVVLTQVADPVTLLALHAPPAVYWCPGGHKRTPPAALTHQPR